MSEPRPDPVDQAWKIHSAIVTWTSGVDSKASFALAIESALIVAVVAMTGGNRALAHLKDWPQQACFWTGIASLVVALLSVAFVVRPRLRAIKAKAEATDNYIYFGHVRRWKAPDLETALKHGDILPVLSRQVIHMSEVAWMKHRSLQLSMHAAAVGAVLLTIAAYLNAHA